MNDNDTDNAHDNPLSRLAKVGLFLAMLVVNFTLWGIIIVMSIAILSE